MSDGRRGISAAAAAARSWADLPPFRDLPPEAIDARLTLPTDGTPAPPAAPDEEPTGGETATLAASPVAWLAGDPMLWAVVPVWPLLAGAARSLRIPLGNSDVVTGLLESIIGDIRRLTARSVLADTGTNEGGEAVQQQVLDRFGERAGADAFLAAHPALARQVGWVLHRHVGNAASMAGRLADDAELLTGLLGHRPTALGEVRATGDLHEAGAVLALRLVDGTRLAYKPRGLALEVGLGDLFAHLETRAPGLGPRVPASLDRGSYGWQAWVPWAPSTSAEAVTGFYRRSGALTAVAHLLRMTDLHHENVRCDGEAPVVVDPECALVGSFTTTADGVGEQIGPKAGTVLNVGVLPDPVQRGDLRVPVDVSALGSVGPRQEPRFRREVRDDGAGGRRLVSVPMPPSEPTHVPVLDGAGPAPVQDGYEEAVLDGFDEAYRILEADREVVADLVARLAPARVRHILKPTWYYAKLLWELGHPEAAACGRRQEEIVNVLWPPDGHGNDRARRIFAHERAMLLRGVIPSFERAAGSRDLVAGSDVVEDAYPTSGTALVAERLAGLSPGDREVQRGLVGATLGILRAPPKPRRGAEAPPSGPPADRTDLLAAAEGIADVLLDAEVVRHGEHWWPVAHDLGHDVYGVQLSPAGLYEGSAGIALFAGLAVRCGAGSPRTADLAAHALQAAKREVEQTVERGTPVQIARSRLLGVWDGMWGGIYALLTLGLAGDPALVAWATEMADAVAAGIERVIGWDLTSGTAGIATVAARAYAATGERAFERAATVALDATATHLEGVLAGDRLPTGMAHGLSGAALAFATADRALPTGQYADAALLVLEAERSEWTGDAWRDTLGPDDATYQATKYESWCRGGAGIGLARLEAAALAAREGVDLRAEVGAAADLVARRGVGGNLSLCHGTFGGIDLLARVPSLPDGRRGPDVAAGLVGGLLGPDGVDGDVDRLRQATGLPAPLPDLGLMTGLAGIGLGLLRTGYAEIVPSVLTLEVRAGGTG